MLRFYPIFNGFNLIPNNFTYYSSSEKTSTSTITYKNITLTDSEKVYMFKIFY